MTEDDRRAIAQLVRDYCDAIATGGPDDLRALWCGRADDTVISVTKEYHGIDEIAEGFLGRLRELYASIVLVADEEPSVRQLSDDTAVVVFRYHTETTSAVDGEPGGIAGIETQVVRRTPQGWKLAHLHYSKEA